MLKPIMVPRQKGYEFKLTRYLSQQNVKLNVQTVGARFLVIKESEASFNHTISHIIHPNPPPKTTVAQLELILPHLSHNVKLKRWWNTTPLSPKILTPTPSSHHVAIKSIARAPNNEQPWFNHFVQSHVFLYKPIFHVINPGVGPNKTLVKGVGFNVWQPTSYLKPKHNLLIQQLKKPLNFFIKNTQSK